MSYVEDLETENEELKKRLAKLEHLEAHDPTGIIVTEIEVEPMEQAYHEVSALFGGPTYRFAGRPAAINATIKVRADTKEQIDNFIDYINKSPIR